MYLYRLETKVNRRGPWNVPSNAARTTWRGHNPSNGPGWHDDGLGMATGSHFTFLQSKALVHTWFKSKHRKMLQEAGFVLAKYKVTCKKKAGLMMGSKQCAAKRDKLQHIADYIIF